ncbi:MAG: hypothetical protein ABI437_14040 [Kofleriaceae bacterium]
MFEARHFPGVVALVDAALEAEPDHVPLLLLRARAHFGLRRDLEAQADLRDIIRLDPHCSRAYRMLGELAARRDEYESAGIFFREALRLDSNDQTASDWLAIVEATPRAAANLLPAPALDSRLVARLAKGTRPPADQLDQAEPHDGTVQLAIGAELQANPFARRAALPGAAPAPRPMTRGPIPEMPGFGDYLVTSGILTRERLRAAQAYQRSMKVQLSTAVVTLGLATPQRVEWAAVAHRANLARPR